MQIKLKSFLLIVFLAFFGKLGAQITFPSNGPTDIRPNSYAIVHVNVQVDSKVLIKNATILIKEGKIEKVGEGLTVPKGAVIIEGRGRYVYPSFIDLHSNYGVNTNVTQKNQNNQFSNNHKGAFPWNDAVKLHNNASDFFQIDEKKSKYYLSGGFGTTLSTQLDGIFRGTSVLVLTGTTHEQKMVLKTKAATGMSFNKGSSRQDYPSSMMGTIALIRQTYHDINWYRGNTTGEINIGFENYIQNQNLPAIFEVENKLAVLRAAKIGKEFNQKYIIKGNGDEYQRINEISSIQCPLILPINFPKPYDVEDPFNAMNVNLGDLKHWEMAPSNLAIVASKGIPFAITSQGCEDAGVFLKNLRKAVSQGLSEEIALNALTKNPATWLKMETKIGCLKPGYLANFFISDGPIFEQESEIEEHWILGEQNIINESKPYKLAGTYLATKFGLKDTSYIEISEKNKQFNVTYYGKDTIKGSLIEQEELFNLTIKEGKESNELIRASLWTKLIDSNSYEVKELNGRVLLPDGNSQSILLKRVLVRTEINKEKKKTTDSIGKVIFPFTEYGNELVPMPLKCVFKGATVWTNELDSILNDMDVAVEDGKIIAIGKGLKLNGAIEIEAKGKFLTSGIIDEHSHIGIYKGVNECTQNITSEVRIGDVVNSEDINIYRQLSGGVVACQQLHGSCNPIGGQSSIIKLRWGKAPEELKIENTDGFIKFGLGENVKQSNWSIESGRYPQTRMGVEQVYFDAFIRAKEYEKFKKANPTKTRIDLELEALVEILNKKRFISCHSYVQSEINMLMHVADSMNFKVNTFTHILEGYKVADKMKKHGASASTFADWWAYKYEVVDAIPQNAAILNKMGIVTAINSDDAEMGRRLNQEAAKIIKYAGISEMDAWKMVTLNPAKMLHLDAKTGSIKVGKDADLVLWTSNPLGIDAKVEMTLVDGVCYFDRKKDMKQREKIQAERMRIIQKMIRAKQSGEKTEKKVSEIDSDYHCED